MSGRVPFGRVIQGRFGGAGPRLPAALSGVKPGGPAHLRVVMASNGHGAANPHAQALPPGLLTLSGGGRPLPEGVRSKMESFFGTDFSDVRVHVGSEAPSIGALAFTIGSAIYFAPGQYNPESSSGQALLGHELTHVVQQRAGRVRNPFGSGIAVVQDPHLEAEADRMGQRAAGHRPAPPVQAKPAPQPVIKPATKPATKGAINPGSKGATKPGTQPGMAAPRPPQPTSAHPAQRRPSPPEGGYRLILGGYLHQERGLPDGLAGHGFVAVERPGGRREAWGFSPAGYDRMDPKRDLGRLTAGVPGKVHRDEGAFAKPGVRTRSFPISRDQAERAMAKVAEYRGGHVQFSLARKQCSSFAMDVARAAGVETFGGARVATPREWMRKI